MYDLVLRRAVCGLTLLLAGCYAELIRPETAVRHDPLEALAIARSVVPAHEFATTRANSRGCGGNRGVTTAQVDGGGVTFSCDGAVTEKVPWSAGVQVNAFIDPNVNGNTCNFQVHDGPKGFDTAKTFRLYLRLPPDEARCRALGEAWLSLSRLGAQSFLTEPGFDAVAARYRATEPRPVPGEDLRRYSVQAEAAVRAKDLIGAARAYGEALKLAPWWPQGRYNRALIMGELGFHPEAIQEMQRYLALVPDAANARQAQDKIYGWEAQAKR